MPTLILRFPAGRYHATPWGHHVNEGLIEWPPSPWRLLRGLLATGYATLRWPPEGPPTEARRLFEALASVLPTYHLPPAVGTHSRHYMPMARFKNGREETTLVFDTWARITGPLAVTWDVALDRRECELLARLAERMG
ncbi:MAG: type I-U CRISPR-associated protein Csb2, partial [Gammaproteobacteria bacterium]|nr:type I-U CRISPR-associated protein Csb2 [Gammaproteobacteria bacterium]